MTLKRVDQLMAGFADGDAISQEARLIRDTLRSLGVASDIYAPTAYVAPRVRDQCRPLEEFAAAPRDAVIYQYAIASEATDLFFGQKGRRIVRYHNITPAEFYAPFDADIAAQLTRARAALDSVVERADRIWAASHYNEAEVRACGGDRVRIVPLFFSEGEFTAPPDPLTFARFRVKLTTWLYVGRLAPNKCVEDAIVAFAWYHRTINPASRLLIVGSPHGCPNYAAMLRLLAARLNLPNVCFEGFVTHASRAALYQLADVFLMPSRHEGYCLPLVEAMWHGKPVVARMIGGMPEAMGNAGVLFDDADPRSLAELVHRVLSDGPVLRDVLSSQSARLAQLRARDLQSECRALLDDA
jgi:glycosyltransferase involved in cell wall biosynthesis